MEIYSGDFNQKEVEELRRKAKRLGYVLAPSHKVRLNIQLKDGLYEKLKSVAKARGVSMNKLICSLIEGM